MISIVLLISKVEKDIPNNIEKIIMGNLRKIYNDFG